VKIIVASELRENIYALRRSLRELKIDAQVVNTMRLRGVLEYSQSRDVKLAEGIKYAKERLTHARQVDPTGDVYIAMIGYAHGDGLGDFRYVVACVTRDGQEAVSYPPGRYHDLKAVVKDALSKVLLKPDVTVSERQQGIASHLVNKGLVSSVADKIPGLRSVAQTVKNHVRRGRH
jgi:hypothetical protein